MDASDLMINKKPVGEQAELGRANTYQTQYCKKRLRDFFRMLPSVEHVNFCKSILLITKATLPKYDFVFVFLTHHWCPRCIRCTQVY